MLRRVAAASGQVMSTQLLQRMNRPELWRQILAKIEDANRDGTRIMGQVMGRPIGLIQALRRVLSLSALKAGASPAHA